VTNWFGTDSFTFRASDGALTSNVARVTITVISSNDAPVALSQSVTTTQYMPKAITLVATDVDNFSLTYTIVSNPANGTLSGTPPNVTYTPTGSFAGTNTFRFRASDGLLSSNTGTVTVIVRAGSFTNTQIYVNVANNTGIENGTPANPFNTIQEGITAAGLVATVNVAAGTYVESPDVYQRRNLMLRGSGAGTIITNLMEKMSIIDSDGITVEGFTMLGGGSYYSGVFVSRSSNVVIRSCSVERVVRDSYRYGGGFEAYDSSITLTSNRICNNYGGQKGGAGYFVRCSLTFTANTVTNNAAWNSAGGLWLEGASTGVSARVTRNNFDWNTADYSGAIDAFGYFNPLQIENNTIVNSGSDYVQGGAVRITPWNINATNRIVNNVIKDTYFPCCYGTRVSLFVNSTGNVYVANNIFTAANGYGIYSYYPNAGIVAEYNDAYGQSYYQVIPGAGSITADPLFMNASTNDYRLQAVSPCVNAGNPAAVHNDTNGTRNDMGRFGGPNGY
jgi:hypothetical protein